MDNDNEIFWIALAIIAVMAIILYIIISDVARFFGAGIAVTGWALFTTFVAIPLMIFILKKFLGEIKNITLTFLSLPVGGRCCRATPKKHMVFIYQVFRMLVTCHGMEHRCFFG